MSRRVNFNFQLNCILFQIHSWPLPLCLQLPSFITLSLSIITVFKIVLIKTHIFDILPFNNTVSVTLSLSLSPPFFCLQMSWIPDTWIALSHHFSTAVFFYTTCPRLPSLFCEIPFLWPATFSFVLTSLTTSLLGAATCSFEIKYTVIFGNPSNFPKYYSISGFVCMCLKNCSPVRCGQAEEYFNINSDSSGECCISMMFGVVMGL